MSHNPCPISCYNSYVQGREYGTPCIFTYRVFHIENKMAEQQNKKFSKNDWFTTTFLSSRAKDVKTLKEQKILFYCFFLSYYYFMFFIAIYFVLLQKKPAFLLYNFWVFSQNLLGIFFRRGEKKVRSQPFSCLSYRLSASNKFSLKRQNSEYNIGRIAIKSICLCKLLCIFCNIRK